MRRLGRGFTLVELMVTLAVASFLLLGVGSLVRWSHDSTRLQQSQAGIQEGARFAFQRLAGDVHNAGFAGCASLARLDPLDIVSNGTNFRTDFTRTLGGHEATSSGAGDTLNLPSASHGWQPNLPAALNGDVAAGSDVLVVRRGHDAALPLSRPKADDRVFVAPVAGLDGDCSGNLCKGDRALVTDCQRGRVFTVNGVQSVSAGTEHALLHNGGNSPTTWGGPTASDRRFQFRDNGAVVQPVTTVAWYIAEDEGTPTLMRWSDSGSASTELKMVRGVDTLQLFYGVDGNGDGSPDRYRDANGVADFDEVVTVHVSLLLQGSRPLRGAASAPSHTLGPGDSGGVTVKGASDHRQHQPLGLTLQLRNRSGRGS